MAAAEGSQMYEAGTEDDYTVHRILHAVPEGSIELPPLSALPLNSNLDLMGGSKRLINRLIS